MTQLQIRQTVYKARPHQRHISPWFVIAAFVAVATVVLAIGVWAAR